MEISIKKVENGFIVNHYETGKEYIFQRWSQVVKYLREWETQTKVA